MESERPVRVQSSVDLSIFYATTPTPAAILDLDEPLCWHGKNPCTLDHSWFRIVDMPPVVPAKGPDGPEEQPYALVPTSVSLPQAPNGILPPFAPVDQLPNNVHQSAMFQPLNGPLADSLAPVSGGDAEMTDGARGDDDPSPIADMPEAPSQCTPIRVTRTEEQWGFCQFDELEQKDVVPPLRQHYKCGEKLFYAPATFFRIHACAREPLEQMNLSCQDIESQSGGSDTDQWYRWLHILAPWSMSKRDLKSIPLSINVSCAATPGA